MRLQNVSLLLGLKGGVTIIFKQAASEMSCTYNMDIQEMKPHMFIHMILFIVYHSENVMKII